MFRVSSKRDDCRHFIGNFIIRTHLLLVEDVNFTDLRADVGTVLPFWIILQDPDWLHALTISNVLWPCLLSYLILKMLMYLATYYIGCVVLP